MSLCDMIIHAIVQEWKDFVLQLLITKRWLTEAGGDLARGCTFPRTLILIVAVHSIAYSLLGEGGVQVSGRG